MKETHSPEHFGCGGGRAIPWDANSADMPKILYASIVMITFSQHKSLAL